MTAHPPVYVEAGKLVPAPIEDWMGEITSSFEWICYRWAPDPLFAFRGPNQDLGKLVVRENSAIFKGRLGDVLISDVSRIRYYRAFNQMFLTTWVEIDYGQGWSAFLRDATPSIGRFRGGAKKLLHAVAHLEARS